MKKFTIKSLALTIALALLTTTIQKIPAQAKASPKLSYKTAILCAPSWDLKGTSVQFRVKNASGKKVTWKSSNKAVAIITSKGLVKPLKRGNTTITAKVGKKTITKRVYVHKHTFDYYNPDKGCKYCNHKTPSCFYSVKTARRDMEQFVKDITTPGMTDAEKMKAFDKWDSFAHHARYDTWDENTETWFTEKPDLPQTAFKYIPNWSLLDGMDPDKQEAEEDKIMDDWCKPRYDKYGQRIPRVTLAEESFADGYDGWCYHVSERYYLFAYMIGLEVVLIQNIDHEICLYKLDGKWYPVDTSMYTKVGNKYVSAEDFKKGGRLEGFHRSPNAELGPLWGIGELVTETSRDKYCENNKRLPAELRP